MTGKTKFVAKSLDKGQALDNRERLAEYTKDPEVKEAMDRSIDRYMGNNSTHK